jgi:hypothetical protein
MFFVSFATLVAPFSDSIAKSWRGVVFCLVCFVLTPEPLTPFTTN